MVSVFLKSSPLPIPKNSTVMRKYAVRLFGETIAKRIINRRAVPGDSHEFISLSNSVEKFTWASKNTYISYSFNSFSYFIENTCVQEISHLL